MNRGDTDGAAPNRAVRAAATLIAFAALAGACLLSLGVGARPVPPLDVLRSLSAGPDGGELAALAGARAQRTVIGLLAGAALGGCGALVQGYTRNPLADPGILGVNAGATFAVTMGAGFLGLRAPLQYVWLALGGALTATLLVSLLGRSGRDGASPVRMTLTGVALGAVLSGLSSFIVLKNLDVFSALRFWDVGSLGGRSPEVVGTTAPFIAAGLLLAALAARSLNALALGEELGTGLGANPRLTRNVSVAGVTLLAGAAVALAGPIGFVGLMVPHMVRRFTGPDQRRILAFAVLLAPVLLLLSDVLGRIALPEGELPVGIVTAIAGAPVLVLLARRQGAGAL